MSRPRWSPPERPDCYIKHVKAVLKRKGDIRCARAGQTFDVSVVRKGVAYGVLECGHQYDALLDEIELLEPLDKLAEQPQSPPQKQSQSPTSCPALADPQQPEPQWRALAPESTKVYLMSDTVQVFGYYVFTRALPGTYHGASNVMDKAAALELDPSYVPAQPEERTCVSTLLTEMGKWLRPQKMKLVKVRAKSEDVCYRLQGAEADDEAFMFWSPDGGLRFSETFISTTGDLLDRARTRFVELKQTLTSTDWSKHLRCIFTEKWNGFPARQGGVIYWVAPNDQEDIQKLGALLASTTGLGLVVAPCLAAPIAFSMLVYGGREELAGLRKRKQADATIRATRSALVEKINRAAANTAIPITEELAQLLGDINQEWEATPTGNPESNKPSEVAARKKKATKKKDTKKDRPAEVTKPEPALAPKDAPEPEVEVPWEEPAPMLPPAPGATTEPVAAPAIEPKKVKRTIVLNGDGKPAEVKEEPIEAAPVTVAPAPAAPPAPAPTAGPAAPPPAPMLPPPPPVEAPDATLAINGMALPLKYQGQPAEGMHAYKNLDATMEPPADSAWELVPNTQVYYCWLGGVLYTSQPLS